MEHSTQGGWPWSPRDYIINHTFDLEIVRITWIMIKGNRVIQDRIGSAIRNQSPGELSSFETLDRAFVSTLMTHLIIGDWAAENWDEFVVFVESKYDEISRRVLSYEIDVLPVMAREPRGGSPTKFKRAGTGWSVKTLIPNLSSSGRATLSSTKMTDIQLSSQSDTQFQAGSKLQKIKEPMKVGGQEAFKFQDLQELHHLHERIKEAILILRLDMKIMHRLAQYFHSMLESEKFPALIAESCADDIDFFQSRLEGLQDDLHTHILKLETLVDYVAGCKVLVSTLGSTYLIWN